MSELDPNILKRNLPEDIHAAVDQVKTNVDAAVKDVVDGYRQYANEIADKFERLEFDKDLQSKLDTIKKDYDADFQKIDDDVAKIVKLATDAKAAAGAVTPASLTKLAQDVTDQTDALTKKLKDFRDKTNALAEKTGGLIAKSAIRAVTGGIA